VVGASVGAKVDWHIELALNDDWEPTLIESESQLFQVGFAEASAELGIVPTFMLEVIVLISGDTDLRVVQPDTIVPVEPQLSNQHIFIKKLRVISFSSRHDQVAIARLYHRIGIIS